VLDPRALRIGVVGNCVAGKSTLVSKLRALGYEAINIPQEHSVTRRFWRHLKPDFLIYLSCTLPIARARRPIEWGQERLNEQWEVLAEAKAHAHLVVDTDSLTADEVAALALKSIDKFIKEQHSVIRFL
jgi:deoxyadenosine/deoxycytidine kinase